jgi:hypothetical protein
MSTYEPTAHAGPYLKTHSSEATKSVDSDNPCHTDARHDDKPVGAQNHGQGV